VLYHFNFYYTNGGSVSAENLRTLPKIYTGKADDKATEMDLARQFEKDWKSDKPQTAKTLVSNSPSFGSVDKTLSDTELATLNNQGTIYFFVRFEYSDAGGRWGTDACESFQRNSATEIATKIGHTCYIFEDFRYPIKRQ